MTPKVSKGRVKMYEEDDLRSISLLPVSTPQPVLGVYAEDDSITIDPSLLQQPSTDEESPATQTLNTLSQSQKTVGLLYDLSQMECDAVRALVQTKNGDADRIAQQLKSPNQDQNDEDYHTVPIFKPKRTVQSSSTRAISVQQIQVATGRCVRTYSSLTLAARGLGCSRHVITDILKGSKHSYQGWTVRYANDTKTTIKESLSQDDAGDDMIKENEEKSVESLSTTKPNARAVPVQQILLETGRCIKTFASLSEASNGTGIKRRKISDIIRHGGSYDRWTFRHAHDCSNKTEKSTTGNTSTKQSISKCIENNNFDLGRVVEEVDAVTGRALKTYQTITAAMIASGIKRDAMFQMLMGVSKASNGKVFRYKDPLSLSMDLEEKFSKKKSAKPGHPPSSNAVDKSSLIPKENKLDKTIVSRNDRKRNKRFRSDFADLSGRMKTTQRDLLGKSKKNVPGLGSDNKIPSGTGESLAVAGKETKTCKECSYETVDVSVNMEGPLGLTIVKRSASKPLINFFYLQGILSGPLNGSSSLKVMIVTDLKDSSIAKSAGVRQGDCILLQKPNKNTISVDYDEIRVSIRSNRRPISLLIVRERASNSSYPEEIEELNAHSYVLESNQRSISSLNVREASSNGSVLKKIEQLQAHTGDSKSKQNISLTSSNYDGHLKELSLCKDLDLVPFCSLCNQRQAAHLLHHAWCPLNPNFVRAGADVILKRIQHGVQIGCSVCTAEYKTGRASSDAVHTDQCRRMQKQQVLSKKTKGRPSNKTTTDFEKKPTNGNVDSQSMCLSHIGESDNDSPFLDPSTKGKYPIHTFELIKKKAVPFKSSLDVAEDVVYKAAPVSIVKGTKSSFGVRKGLNTVIRKNMKQKAKITIQNRRSSKLAKNHKNRDHDDNIALCVPGQIQKDDCDSRNVDDSINTEDPKESLNVVWEECENVWGAEGYLDGDIVALSSKEGVNFHAAPFSTSRYEMDPFSSPNSRYRRTHIAPEEGYHNIKLTRDFQARTPWGFSCQRHENGNACIVTCIHPHSPAEAAIYQGANKVKAPLRVNDLLIAVNGKDVGGMTSTGFEIECELSGYELALTVSRYRFPINLQTRNFRNEKEHFEKVDNAISDERRLDWIELGDDCSHKLPLDCMTFHEDIVSGEDCLPRSDASSLSSRSQCRYTNRFEVLESTCSPTIQKNTYQIQDKESITLGGIDDDKIHPKHQMLKDTCPSQFQTAERSDTDDEMLSDDDDDGNAWYDCVCGNLHAKTVSVFWIQCDCCKSWYNVASECVGFSQAEAADVVDWTCWSCPVANQGVLCHTETPEDGQALDSCETPLKTKTCSLRSKSDVSAQTFLSEKCETSQNTAKASEKTLCQQDIKKHESEESVDADNDADTKVVVTPATKAFVKDNLVEVIEHAWPGVNNSSGIAKIQKAYVDGDGDQVYDIKYIVGGRSRGVLHEYLRPFKFYYMNS